MSELQCAIVTGAARGIGRAITLRLLRDGWQVFAVDRDSSGLEVLGASGAAQHRLETIIADVGSEPDLQAALGRVRDRTDRLHGLVCNAGIMIRKPLEAVSLAEWNQVLGVNLTGTFLLTRDAAPLLRASGRGCIVTVASTRAHMSEPDTESYAASKGGLLALTHALSISLGPRVRANCISPGWIDVAGEALSEQDHAQHPAGRVGSPEDIASLAAWLLGPESRFVTGAEFIVDGGMTRKMIYTEE